MIIGLLVVFFAIFGIMAYSYYNGMVTKEEKVTAQWAQVENLYQRRSDLIQNLVNTVKGYADFEQETLTQVIEARSKATSITVDASKIDATNLAAFEQAQNGLNTAMSRLLVTVEKYPDLKANQNFSALMVQLQETENMLAVERNTFNEVARQYNTDIRKFPRNMFASMFGFEQKAYFKAEEGANKVPVVKFD
ncbi:MAG: LemA family protein [Bacteroidetes bacterium HGW-Bacteroidetes-21]|nr:MAG: LemA family protein [Bacteroidetes bacterium HGW-Bacteroidetes-21]